jgi:hypothetical protein
MSDTKTRVPLPTPPLDAEELSKAKDALPALTLKQQEMAQEVLKHFEQEAYRLPGSDSEKRDGGALEDVEKFWLVSEPCCSLVAKLTFDRLWRRHSLMSVCSGISSSSQCYSRQMLSL